MSIIYWIVFGLITGGIADYLAPSNQGGIIGTIILGIVGAIVGGYLGQMFFNVGVTGFNVMSFVVSVAGSLIVIYVGRMLMRA